MTKRMVLLVVALTGLLPTLPACRSRAGSPGADPEDLEQVIAGQNAFAIDLYHQLASQPGNLLVSPFSISTALAMTYAGARGQTEREMAAVLHFPERQSVLHAVLQTLLAALDGGNAERPYQLDLANRLWARKGLSLLPDFLTTTRESYGAELAQLDFRKNPEAARRTINGWVADRTARKIRELLLPGDVTGSTPLVLTNAIYFHGRWRWRFPAEATREGRFHLSSTQQVDVPLMYQRGRFAFAGFPDVELLQLPYVGEELALVLLLPQERDDLPALEKKLTTERLREWFQALREQEIGVFLPRFSLTCRYDLADVLVAMGMKTACGRDADFSGMTGNRDLFIDRAIHETFLEIDEEGTKAAAATAVVLKGGPQPFRADHPFLFLIRDLRHESILFLGRLVDPRAE